MLAADFASVCVAAGNLAGFAHCGVLCLSTVLKPNSVRRVGGGEGVEVIFTITQLSSEISREMMFSAKL